MWLTPASIDPAQDRERLVAVTGRAHHAASGELHGAEADPPDRSGRRCRKSMSSRSDATRSAGRVSQPAGRAPSRSGCRSECRSPIGTAPKNTPQSAPSGTTTTATWSPANGSPATSTTTSVVISQPSVPLTVIGRLAMSRRLGSVREVQVARHDALGDQLGGVLGRPRIAVGEQPAEAELGDPGRVQADRADLLADVVRERQPVLRRLRERSCPPAGTTGSRHAPGRRTDGATGRRGRPRGSRSRGVRRSALGSGRRGGAPRSCPVRRAVVPGAWPRAGGSGDREEHRLLGRAVVEPEAERIRPQRPRRER